MNPPTFIIFDQLDVRLSINAKHVTELPLLSFVMPEAASISLLPGGYLRNSSFLSLFSLGINCIVRALHTIFILSHNSRPLDNYNDPNHPIHRTLCIYAYLQVVNIIVAAK